MLLALNDIVFFFFFFVYEARWKRGTGKAYLRAASQLRAMFSITVEVMPS